MNVAINVSKALLLAALVLASPARAALSGVYTFSGGTDSQSGQTYSATAADQSSVFVYNGGSLTLTNATLTESGTASNTTNNYQDSSQYGNNAGVLAGTSTSSYNGTSNTVGTVIITGSTSLNTSANGDNGLYATFTGSSISMTGGSITTTGTFSHGVDATYGGSITLNNVTINTSGSSGSAGMSTDFGGGTVTATNVNVTTKGSGSPDVYSTGTISVSGSTLNDTVGGVGIIDGSGNSITLTNDTSTGVLYGVRVFHSAPNPATAATVTINGGSLAASGGDAFFVDGSATSGGAALATITVEGGAAISESSGILVHATVSTATTHTTNEATFIASGETLTGNLVTDAYSTITATLQSSTTLTGAVNNAATGTNNLTVDATSVWSVSAASTLASLTTAGTISGAGTVTATTMTLQSGTISAVLSSVGSLTKTTAGMATLSNSNTYTGATAIEAGTLVVTGAIAGSAVTIGDSANLSTSAELMGTGTVGSVTLGAAANNTGALLEPGSAANKTGILDTGSLTANSGATLSIQLGGKTPGMGTNNDGTNGYDQLDVAGTVSLGNVNLQLSLINGFGSSLQLGEKFFVILNDGTDAVSGTFAQGSTVSAGGDTFAINYADNGDGGSVANDVSLTLMSVPEPNAAMLLLFTGAAFTGMIRRRVSPRPHQPCAKEFFSCFP